jgi:hypothetical protein
MADNLLRRNNKFQMLILCGGNLATLLASCKHYPMTVVLNYLQRLNGTGVTLSKGPQALLQIR